jgi:Protein of unknown function (DUF3570)
MRAKRHVAAMAHRGAVVVAIKIMTTNSLFYLVALFVLVAQSASAAVLPDERIDALYHSYDGGGVSIDGPSILLRKNIGPSISVSANYYVDMVTSASIDVETTASPYTEEREENSLTALYLVDRSTMTVAYTHSKESDYDAKTISFGIDQTFFGDLTTLGFGVSLGDDIVGQNTDPNYKRDLQRRKYSINASQILTKSLLASISFDSATDRCLDLVQDDTCLNNPYRSVRYGDVGDPSSGAEKEKYPQTRNSDALGLRTIYYLPYRASVRLDLRKFSDSWGTDSENAEIRYLHPWREWLFEVKYRTYKQTAADFYSDLFPFQNAQNFLARDKELSPFSSSTIGIGATYKVPAGIIPWFEKSTVNFYWDHIAIDYDDFRDARVSKDTNSGVGIGLEPLYSLEANVIRFYVSFWY